MTRYKECRAAGMLTSVTDVTVVQSSEAN